MLTHLDENQRPRMVDVGDKAETTRMAHAVAHVRLPAPLAALLREGELHGPKGPVFDTAILAGVMGAKRTSDLIPLCHPLPLDLCRVEILPRPPEADGSRLVEVHCHARTHGRTGVEMEALTGATIAALTLYDMGKAVTHDIEIEHVRLLEKTGGKADFCRTT